MESFRKNVYTVSEKIRKNGQSGPKIVLLAPFPWKQEFSQNKRSCQFLALIVLKHYGKFQEERINSFWEKPENGHFGPKIVLLAPFPWKQEFSKNKGSCQFLALIVLNHYRKFQIKIMSGFWENSENSHFGPKIVLLAVSMEIRIFPEERAMSVSSPYGT